MAQNPYLIALENAERAKEKKRQANAERGAWWKDPRRFLDDEDMDIDEAHWGHVRIGYILARASAIFGDCTPIEREVFLKMLTHALKAVRPLTERQADAVGLATIAKQLGTHQARFVASVLGITETAAQRRLSLAKQKVVGAIYLSDTMEVEASEHCTCAVCGNTCPASHALCWGCHQKYVVGRNFSILPEPQFNELVRLAMVSRWSKKA